jgi:hypothetical protein
MAVRDSMVAAVTVDTTVAAGMGTAVATGIEAATPVACAAVMRRAVQLAVVTMAVVQRFMAAASTVEAVSIAVAAVAK